MPRGPTRGAAIIRAVLDVARRTAACALLAAGLSGCAELGYLEQASLGQLDLLARTRPIGEVLRDDATPARVRSLLAEVPKIKRFGERHGLRPTKSYARYSDLQRSAAVWVVTACEPLRFRSKTWWFPIVGTVPYLGWFDQDDANDLARDLHEQGWDVDVREASAYSTLGWFHDPVLSTMLPEGDDALGDLADVVLHESLHATLYLEDQSPFNESVASFVGEHLAAEYLAEAAPSKRAAFVSTLRDGKEREREMLAARTRLVEVYASKRSDAEKRAAKKKILDELHDELDLSRPVSNATLAELETYGSGTDELEALLKACDGSFPRFVGALRTVGSGAFAESQQTDLKKVLLPLVQAGCAAPPRAK